MADLVGEMIKNSLDSFIRNDLEMAEEVRRTEQITDDLNETDFPRASDLYDGGFQNDSPFLNGYAGIKKSGAYCRSCQGIADMVTYMVTGECVRHQTYALGEKEPA